MVRTESSRLYLRLCPLSSPTTDWPGPARSEPTREETNQLGKKKTQYLRMVLLRISPIESHCCTETFYFRFFKLLFYYSCPNFSLCLPPPSPPPSPQSIPTLLSMDNRNSVWNPFLVKISFKREAFGIRLNQV